MMMHALRTNWNIFLHDLVTVKSCFTGKGHWAGYEHEKWLSSILLNLKIYSANSFSTQLESYITNKFIICFYLELKLGWVGLTFNPKDSLETSHRNFDPQQRVRLPRFGTPQRYNLDGNLEGIAPTTDFTCTSCH